MSMNRLPLSWRKRVILPSWDSGMRVLPDGMVAVGGFLFREGIGEVIVRREGVIFQDDA
jgi:hypothetical protein